MNTSNKLPAILVALTLGLTAWLTPATIRAQQSPSSGQGFSFTTAVDLVTVTATVTDRSGRFVSGLRADDFTIVEDGKSQTISQFDSERVPVSLGIALDTSGSMAGERIAAAQDALGRFVDLLGSQDEMFLLRFDNAPRLVQGWTSDRGRLLQRLGSVRPNGGTALYDAVDEAVPLTASGTKRKKALVVISDGNDTNSRTSLPDVRQAIRGSEVLVYAIAVEGEGTGGQIFFPIFRRWPAPRQGRIPAGPGGPGGVDARVNVSALRMMTDDSGGRTEVLDSTRDLERATAGIADELSKQYFLGYVSTRPSDGRWHAIDVRVRRGDYTVRARNGYLASSDHVSAP